MKQSVIITVRLFSPKKAEHEIEVPLTITARELQTAICTAFCAGTDPETLLLRTERPVAFLTGDIPLSAFGMRDGTVVNVMPAAQESPVSYGKSVAPDLFAGVVFDKAADLSEDRSLTIGNTAGCDLLLTEPASPLVCVRLTVQGSECRLETEQCPEVSCNGKTLSVGNVSTPVHHFDFITVLGECFYYHNRTLYFDRRSPVQPAASLQCRELSESVGSMHYPEFIRNSRLRLKLSEEPISLLTPKEKPQKPKSNLFLKLMPALGMVAMTVLLRGVMGNGNMGYLLFSVGSVTMGAVVSVATIISDAREYKHQIVEREIGYRSYIDTKRAEIEELRREELQLLNHIYYSYEITSGFAQNFSGNLFDRTPADDDFLALRIGTGTVESVRKIDYRPQETYESDADALVDLPRTLAEEYRNLSGAPILIRLKEANVVGIVGTDTLLYEMMKIMFFDLCIRQHYDDVTAVLLTNAACAQQYDWIKWFRHIHGEKQRHIVCDEQSRSAVFEYLYSELNRRAGSRDKEKLPHIVVFVMDDNGIREHPVSKYIETASECGATFLFFGNERDHIPLGCTQLVLMDSDSRGRIINNENTAIVDFMYVHIPDAELYAISEKLAPVYGQEVSLAGALTRSLTLFDLLGIRDVQELDLAALWSHSDVTVSMAAPIGVKAGDETVYLDIHDGEGCHGPHGLVAGTTGSGKSELLMTYILSLAIRFSPLEVAFLIIDFKAGGMADHFRSLPHTRGIITNIDGKEIDRSLISIEAEIERRQKLFAQAEETVGSVVDSIDKYIRAWKAGQVTVPLPHLIIIVDEFAELKKQFPDFMETLKSAARIGRTLGVHLILATQRPSGQIDPQIDSNSRFRLCLKVQSAEDSRDMLNTPLAAEIREAGRSYFMVQNSDILDLVQSAYSGAPADPDWTASQRSFTVYSVDFAGRRTPIYQKKPKKPANADQLLSQNEAVTAYIREYCESAGLPELPRICQPPLPAVLRCMTAQEAEGLTLSPVSVTASNAGILGAAGNRQQGALALVLSADREALPGIYADLGVYDAPARQRQELYTINAAAQNTFILGALQSGKTTLLQQMIRSLSTQYPPEQVQFYLIDYASLLLANFDALPHVGGVVVPNEEERLSNLLKLLGQEITQRKQHFKRAGVSSFLAYREAGHRDLPLIVVMIDNLSMLRELHPEHDAALLSLMRDGLSVGISFTVANSTTKGIDHKYLSAFSGRIGLFHHNTDEYGILFGGYKLSVESVPGRALVSIEKSLPDCQMFLSFDGEREIDRVEAIRTYTGAMQAQYPSSRAKRIPEIPEFLLQSELMRQQPECFRQYNTILGYNYDTLEPVCCSLSGRLLFVSGTPGTGKTNLIRYFLGCLRAGLDTCPVQAVIFDKPTVKSLESYASESFVDYRISGDGLRALCKEWKTELERRKALVLEHHGDLSVLEDLPLLLMIFEDSGKDTLNDLDEELLGYTAYKFSWIASNVDNEDLSPMRTPKLYRAKALGADCMLFGMFSASNLIDGFVKIPLAEKRERLGIAVSPGDAFYVSAADPTRVLRLKTVICAQE
ncbi:MAG: type VII secretion protein EssC [Oscillospiraceae bacterium]|nr:type VII secretion protein EssC [Oscillospiraceae bacterium]